MLISALPLFILLLYPLLYPVEFFCLCIFHISCASSQPGQAQWW